MRLAPRPFAKLLVEALIIGLRLFDRLFCLERPSFTGALRAADYFSASMPAWAV
jgi:hypothetical protein